MHSCSRHLRGCPSCSPGSARPVRGVPIATVVMFVLRYLLQRLVLNLIARSAMLDTLLITFGLNVVFTYLRQMPSRHRGMGQQVPKLALESIEIQIVRRKDALQQKPVA